MRSKAGDSRRFPGNSYVSPGIPSALSEVPGRCGWSQNKEGTQEETAAQKRDELVDQTDETCR